MSNEFIYILAGIASGFVAGILGIGGGLLLVPFLISQGVSSSVATSTSLCAIALTSTFGSIQNYYRGQLNLINIPALAIPSMITVSVGAIVSKKIPDNILEMSFGLFLLINIYLVKVKKSFAKNQDNNKSINLGINLLWPKILTGSLSGFLAGIFGVGGGVVLVPLQIILLGENIKNAVVTSLGVIVLTSISGTITNLISGNVLLLQGCLLGLGGIIGVTISTKLLIKLPEKLVEYSFIGLMLILSIYMFKNSLFN